MPVVGKGLVAGSGGLLASSDRSMVVMESHWCLAGDGRMRASSCRNRRDSTAAAVKVSWMEKLSSCGSRGDGTAVAVERLIFQLAF